MATSAELDANFLAAVALTKNYLLSVFDYGKLTKLTDQSSRKNPWTVDEVIDLQALSALGGIINLNTFANRQFPFGDNGLQIVKGKRPEPITSPEMKPPPWLSTETLLVAIQDIIAENQKRDVGLERGHFQAINKQTQFLLDLQRYIARKVPSRLAKLTRAAHRRTTLAGDRGPIVQFVESIEDDIASTGSNR